MLRYGPVVVMNGRGELGRWLRQQREDRFWGRAEMARQLIAAAHAHGDMSSPDAGHIMHNIYRWERGVVAPSERYRLYYCKAFGIVPASFGTLIPQHAAVVSDGHAVVVSDGQAEAVLGFLAGVMEKWQQLKHQLGAEPSGDAERQLSDADSGQALDALRLAWGDTYGIGYGSGQWQAMRRDGTQCHGLSGFRP
jgi:hypothetical protein